MNEGDRFHIYDIKYNCTDRQNAVWVASWDTFYSGEEPSNNGFDILAGSGGYPNNNPFITFKMKAKSILKVGSIVYVCANEQQRKDAIDRAKLIRKERIEATNPHKIIKECFKDCWKEVDDHVKRFHGKGCCWSGDMYCTYSIMQEPRYIRNIFTTGEVDKKEFLDNIPPIRHEAVLYFIEYASKEEREQLINEAGEEYRAEQKEAGKAFARQQIEKLKEMGFSQKTAVNIMKSAGPGRCVAAADWAIYAAKIIDSIDLLDCVLCGKGGTHKFGKERMEGVIEALGLTPPHESSSAGFFAILSGAHTALVEGLAKIDLSNDAEEKSASVRW